MLAYRTAPGEIYRPPAESFASAAHASIADQRSRFLKRRRVVDAGVRSRRERFRGRTVDLPGSGTVRLLVFVEFSLGGQRGNVHSPECRKGRDAVAHHRKIHEACPQRECPRVGFIVLARLEPAVDPPVEGLLGILADSRDREAVGCAGGEKRRDTGDLASWIDLRPDLGAPGQLKTG